MAHRYLKHNSISNPQEEVSATCTERLSELPRVT